MRTDYKTSSSAGIPDSPSHLRPLAYRRLLNLSPNTLSQYSAFVDEISQRLLALPPPSSSPLVKPPKEDRLLREIERDVGRTFGALAWFGAAPGEGVAVDEEDAFWGRVTLLEQLDDSVVLPSIDKSPVEAASEEGEGRAKPKPPVLSLVPPTEAGAEEAVGMVLIPPTPSSPVLVLEAEGTSSGSLARPRTRRQALLRPLFVYAMLNPGLSYVQGCVSSLLFNPLEIADDLVRRRMNSIVAVFWWIFAGAGSELEGEADAFFALGAIISQLQDLYVSSLDGTISPSPSSPRFDAVGSAPRPVTPTGLGATLGSSV